MPGCLKSRLPLSIFAMSKIVAEELDRLDPRDFLPSAQYDFVIQRMKMRLLALEKSITISEATITPMCQQLTLLLDQYGGKDSQAAQRDFTYISDVKLRIIVERDYKELSTRLFPSGSWKSVVILAGSILEAVLYDALTKDAQSIAMAIASTKAPKKGNLVKGDWTLCNMIDVAEDLKLLPTDRAKSIDQVLRDYRNFVHPKIEVKATHPCSEAEAFMAKGALDAVFDHLNP